MKVGDKIVYCLRTYSYVREAKVREGVITKVGKQYIYINDSSILKVDKKSLRGVTPIGDFIEVFLTKQDWENAEEKRRLWYNIKKHFDQSTNKNKTSLEDLREVARLLGVVND